MKKLGLVSVWNHNYGSLLQTYALQEFLKQNEYKSDIILYQENDFRKILRFFNLFYIKQKFQAVFKQITIYLFYNPIHKKLILRDQKFSTFKKQHLQFSKKFISISQLSNTSKTYSCFILGSDQVLHPANLNMKFFTLEFLPKNKYKIAYAPSFGVSKIPYFQKERTKKYLNSFNNFSVREKSGQKIIFDLLQKKVPIVCDPTLLLEKHTWNIFKGKTPIVKNPYILCYFLGANIQHRIFAEKIKKITGLEIVNLPFTDQLVTYDIDREKSLFDIGPIEFVNLISNAEFVITDSFHGTVFSIIFEKTFFTFNRFSGKGHQSTNSRIESLLDILGISDRRFHGHEKVEDVLELKINYTYVNEKLESFRNFSKQYLLKSLEQIEK